MTEIRIGSTIYPTIADALQAAITGDFILVGAGTTSAPLLLSAAPKITLRGSGSNGQSTLVNTPILERSGQGKISPNFTIQDLTFDYSGQSGYLFAPSIGSVPYNPADPILTSFTLRNVSFTGKHFGNAGVSGTYMDISGAKNTIFDGIRVSLSGQDSYDPARGTGGGFFIFHEGGAGIQILNSDFNELGYSTAIILLYIADAKVQGNRFTGGGLIKQDDDNPRGERFVNAGGLFANNHLSNGSFFDYLLQINSDTGTVWTDYKRNFATPDGTFGLRTVVTGNTFDILPSGFGLLIRADVSPQTVEKMLTISGNSFNNGLAIRSDLASPYDLTFGANYVNGIHFDHLRVGGTSADHLNLVRAAGNNWISGGLGNDFLYSTPNKFDAFVFHSPLNAQTNLDRIFEFETSGTEADQIWLHSETFPGIVGSIDQLNPNSFIANISGSASGNSSQIIYNTTTGELLYDADGAGAQKSVAFTILSGRESITSQSFRLFNVTSPPPISPSLISLSASPSSVVEDGPTNLTYTFTRTGSISSALTINYSVGGTATLGTDYTGITGTPASITFAAGSATATVTIDPSTDSAVEPDETVALSLASGSGYTIGTTTAVVGTISNDDVPPPPVVTLAVSPASVPEDGPNNLIYTFSRTGPTTNPLTVNYTTGGSATLGTDYTGIPGTPASITFAPGSSTATLTVDPTNDSAVEPDETVALSLAAGIGYTIGTADAIMGTITSDDVVPTASALPKPKVIGAVDLDSASSSPATQSAGNAFDNKSSTKYLNFGGINSGVNFTYSLPTQLSSFAITTANDVPARDPASYQLYGFQGGSWRLLTSGKLNLPSGRLKKSALVSLPNLPSLSQYRLIFPKLKANGNVMQIADLKLYGTQSSALPKPATATPIDLDSSGSSPPTQSAANVFDNKTSTKYINFGGINSGVNFTYNLPTRISSFVITTANDVPGRDPAAYQLYGFSQGSWKLLKSGSLQLPSARLTDSTPISLPNLPSLTQYRLIFPRLRANGNVMQIAELKLFGSQSSPSAPPPAALPVVTLAISPASVPEDGPNNLIYTFSRSGPTTHPLTVNYSTGGTATPGSDYTGLPGTPASITFAAGSATATVTIDPSTDSAVEPDETVALSLASGSGYTIGTTTAVVGTITNDDVPPPPVVTLAVSLASVPEDGPNNLIYTFSRSGPTTHPLTVNYSTGGTATPGSDYTGLPGTPASITFAAGSATATVTIDPSTDSAVEPDETVALSLADGSGYTIGTTTAVVGTIANDDGVVPPTPGAWTYDWASASTLGNIPSILKASVALPSPRAGEAPLALTALRVDLRDPAIQLTSTGRRSDWANNTIETTSETSRQYISRSRTSGLPIVAAMNTAPFDLDLANQLLSVPTNIRGFAVSDGVLVSSTDYNTDTFKSTFLYDPVTGARIQTLPSSLPAASAGVSYPAPAAEVALASTLKVATSGFGIVLNNGVVSGDQLLQNARSALGLTADGRYLTMLTVDRVFNPAQPSGWQGATDHDVGTILKGFGSTMGINVDGGGSTQLAWWNPTNNQAELLNNPLFERYVGASLGVAYQPI